jgi:hypothetical protein
MATMRVQRCTIRENKPPPAVEPHRPVEGIPDLTAQSGGSRVRAWLNEFVTAKELLYPILAGAVYRIISTNCQIRLKLIQFEIDLAMKRAEHEMQIALERERRDNPERPIEPPDQAA